MCTLCKKKEIFPVSLSKKDFSPKINLLMVPCNSYDKDSDVDSDNEQFDFEHIEDALTVGRYFHFAYIKELIAFSNQTN